MRGWPPGSLSRKAGATAWFANSGMWNLGLICIFEIEFQLWVYACSHELSSLKLVGGLRSQWPAYPIQEQELNKHG